LTANIRSQTSSGRSATLVWSVRFDSRMPALLCSMSTRPKLLPVSSMTLRTCSLSSDVAAATEAVGSELGGSVGRVGRSLTVEV
jgi:hypothetical protein